MKRETYLIEMLITTLGVVVLDLAAKAAWFGREEMWTRFAPLLQTVHHRNYGLVFDIPAPGWLIVSLSLIVLVVAGYSLRRRASDAWMAFGFGLLIGGALGNLYDRLVLGFVRDWILAFGRSAFNVADVAVILGLLVMAWRMRRVDGSGGGA